MCRKVIVSLDLLSSHYLGHAQFELKQEVKSILESNDYWTNLPLCHSFLNEIGICTAYLEGDMVPSSAICGTLM